MASGDKEQLNAFCRAVEGLLPSLNKLRNYQGSGTQWAAEIRRLVQHFLAVPDDLPEEEQVRDRLLWSLSQLEQLDSLQAAGAAPLKLPLALVREFVQENLEALEGIKGELLTGGVTIAPMQAVRFVPFRVLYILGLNEELFPGSNALPSFDLRACQRCRGDIHPAENNRFLFLEALLAARDKVYLFYNSRDLQRDQDLQPAVPLTQLCRYLEEHIIGQKVDVASVPLSGGDSKYLEPATDRVDVLVNYNETDRLLALKQAGEQGTVHLDDRDGAELARRLENAAPQFHVLDAGPRSSPTTVPTISIGELRRFLLSPAEACLKRHLRLEAEEELELQDDEPFWTDGLGEHQLITNTLERFVFRTVRDGLDAARADWRECFVQRYDEWELRSRAPEGAFAEVDRAGFEAALEERIEGADGLAEFLHRRSAGDFVGPILIGESTAPIGARLHFPALTLEMGRNLYGPPQVRLVGSLRLAWRTPKSFEVLVLSNKKPDSSSLQTEISKYLLEPVLFWLALKAGKESISGEPSSSQWLENLSLRVHLSHQEGITCFTYRPGDASADKARTYLTDLAADLLDPSSYDLLPLDVLIHCEDFRQAYQIDKRNDLPNFRHFQRRLQDFLEDDRENDYSTYRWSELLNLSNARVPLDALAKVRRRFRILDGGPHRNRQPKKEAPASGSPKR